MYIRTQRALAVGVSVIILYTIHLRKKVFFIIYDIPHCIGNVIVCLLLFKPLDKIIGKAVYSEEYNNE
ncbi:MAG TPA: hypothetical protein IAC14_11460 [Candidatus Scybalomonas excrementigallinarum]|nr:hypothetical protein [Candidatus Scybalomonas excrementigallinarum]